MNYIEKFVESCKTFNRYSDDTLKNYQVAFRQFNKFINKSLKEITRSDIEGFINHLSEVNGGITINTINVKLSALDSLFEYLKEDNIINKNPTKNIKRGTPKKKEWSGLTENEIQTIINQADKIRDKAILSLLFASACRVSEFVNLNITDIYELPDNIEKEGIKLHIRNGKGNKERFVFIPQKYFKYTHEYIKSRTDDNNEALFLSNRNKRIHQDTVRYIISHNRKKAGIERKITPHTFRKSCLTHLINNGVDIVTVSKHAGHSDVAVTDRHYTKLADEIRANATLDAF